MKLFALARSNYVQLCVCVCVCVCVSLLLSYYVAMPYKPVPYHAVSAVIAVNMTLAAASGGIVAVIIASWAQVFENLCMNSEICIKL